MRGQGVSRSATTLVPALGFLAPFACLPRSSDKQGNGGGNAGCSGSAFCLAWACRQSSDWGMATSFWDFCLEAAASCDFLVTQWDFSPRGQNAPQLEPARLAARAGLTRESSTDGPEKARAPGVHAHTPHPPNPGAPSPTSEPSGSPVTMESWFQGTSSLFLSSV